MTSFSPLNAHGKLLLLGEYFVLEGALGVAVPTRMGQQFSMTKTDTAGVLRWESYTHKNDCWFWAEWNWLTDQLTSSDLDSARQYWFPLVQHSGLSRKLHPVHGYRVVSKLDFPRDWGLGSSSTLVAALARWGRRNPYHLLARTFGGSGYDLPAAWLDQPYTFQWKGKVPVVVPLVGKSILPPIDEATAVFVHLGEKKNSREAIRHFRQVPLEQRRRTAAEISLLTKAFLNTRAYHEQAEIIQNHEIKVGEWLGLTPVKQRLFGGFPGVVKSLGAWGGDFVWAMTDKLSFEECHSWFIENDYPAVHRAQDFAFV